VDLHLLQSGYLPLLLGMLLALGLAVSALLYWRYRRRRQPVQRLRRAAAALMDNVILPDGNGGEILIELLLLTSEGIMVLDIRHADGHVFGSEAMEEWTVLAHGRRYTFGNPQHALYDRVAAVRRVVSEVPVAGYIVFAGRAEFSRGKPRHVLLLEELLGQLEQARSTAGSGMVEAFMPHWDRLQNTAVALSAQPLALSGRPGI